MCDQYAGDVETNELLFERNSKGLPEKVMENNRKMNIFELSSEPKILEKVHVLVSLSRSMTFVFLT